MALFATTPFGILAGAAFTAVLLFAAIGDVRSRRIPNQLVLVLAVLGIIYSAVTRGPLWGSLRAIEGIVVGMGLWIPFYALGWLGAGDVKLVGAAGAWLGPMETIEGSFIAALLGALLALLWMLRSRGLKHAVETLGVATTMPSVLAETSPKISDRRRSLPYSVPLVVGALCAAWLPGLLFG
ncbi:MAG TPA: prepilin peptidase [Gemmatimonadaceae bacterium]|nr:prepilin peptidase [Gemmatimonadaceae bacterium]